MRIYKNKFYIMETVPGISGFQRWDEREYRVCTGYKACNHRAYIVSEFNDKKNNKYRLENGRVPEHQPVVNAKKMKQWLLRNPYQTAMILEAL